MRLGQQGARAPRGSFGIPQDMHPDAVAKAREESAAAATPPEAPTAEDSNFEFEDEESPQETAAPGSEQAKKKTPKEILAEIGVTITTDNWSDLFFRGSLEKVLHVGDIPQPDGSVAPFSVTVKTLTAEEFDMADELLADDIQNTNMTRDGLDIRKQMWVFSFAISKVNGRPICKPVTYVDPKTKTEAIDPKGTARAKRKVLSQMSPVVLNMALEKYWTFTSQINALTSDPKKNFFEKP